MSFRISARGVPHFRYERNNNIDGSDFEIVNVMSILHSMEPTRMGMGAAAYEYISSIGEHTDLTETFARRRMLSILSDAVRGLAICSGAENGSIGVSATQSHLLRPDTSRFATYRFLNRDDPGPAFISTISPILSDTDMNNWGVLRALALALYGYSDHILESATPYITIQLSK